MSRYRLVKILGSIFVGFVLATISRVFMFDQSAFNVFLPPVTIAQSIWSAAVTDYAVKLITVAFKVSFTLVPVSFIPFGKRVGAVFFLLSNFLKYLDTSTGSIRANATWRWRARRNSCDVSLRVVRGCTISAAFTILRLVRSV